MERLLVMMQTSLDSRMGRPRTIRPLEDRLVGASLLRRRAWYADPPPADNQGDDSGGDGGEGDGGNGKSNPPTVPYDKFAASRRERREALKRADDLQKRLQVYEQAEAETKRKKAEDEGRHSEIIAELEPKAKRVDELEKTVKAILAAELEAVPEEFRDLIPAGDVTAQLEWLRAARAKGLFEKKQQRQAPPTDAGANGDNPKDKNYIGSEQHRQDVAKRLRLNRR